MGDHQLHGPHLAAPKSKVTQEEYNDFYKGKFGDWQDPLLSIHIAAEGPSSTRPCCTSPARCP